MQQLSARIYRPDELGHSGTGWLVAENYVLTALHCVCKRDSGARYPVAACFRLRFEGGREVKAVLEQGDPEIDAALLRILDPLAARPLMVFGTLPSPEARRQEQGESSWQSYGYPSGYPEGMGISGTVHLAGSADRKDIQLTCDQGGAGSLDGMSGACVEHDGYIVGIIRSAPESFGQRVIHATSMRAIQEKLPIMAQIVERSFNQAVARVAPNLLGAGRRGDADGPDAAGAQDRGRNALYARDADVIELRRILDEGAQLLTLVGPAGVGKSRLAAELTGEPAGPYGPVYNVDLRTRLEPPDVLVELAGAIGLRDAHSQLLEESIAVEIGKRGALLVVNGNSQLASSCAPIRRLLGACPRLRIVVLGEAPLGWDGEQVMQVKPFRNLDTRAARENLLNSPVLRLFADRVRAVQPGYVLDLATVPYAAELCGNLGGVPLAIELVAARAAPMLAPEMDVEQFLELKKGLQKLPPAGPDRLSGVIDLAIGDLDREAQLLLPRLSVFVGDFTSEAAHALVSGLGSLPRDSVDTLDQLARRHLLVVLQRPRGKQAYRLQSAVRIHGRRKLQESGQWELTLRQFARYYARLATKTDRRQMLLSSVEVREWLDQLELEYDNLRAALSWPGAAEPEHGEPGLHIVGNLFWFWNLRGSLAEGIYWTNAMLRHQHQNTEGHALALYCRGGLAFLQGDFPAARRDLEKSVVLWTRLDNKRRLGFTLVILGMVALHQGLTDEAYEHEMSSMSLFNATDERSGLALAQNDLANVLLERGDLEQAEVLYRKSRDLWHEQENYWGLGLTAANLGHLACRRHRYDDARMWLVEAMRIQKQGRYQWGFAQSIKFLAAVMLKKENHQTAASLYYDSMILHHRLGRRQLVADCLDGLAEVALGLDDPLSAAQLLGAAGQIREQCGVGLPPLQRATREALVQRALGQAAASGVGEDADAALELGGKMDLGVAVRTAAAYAMRFKRGRRAVRMTAPAAHPEPA